VARNWVREENAKSDRAKQAGRGQKRPRSHKPQVKWIIRLKGAGGHEKRRVAVPHNKSVHIGAESGLLASDTTQKSHKAHLPSNNASFRKKGREWVSHT